MIDQNSQFFAILTNIGIAKQANADALGIPWLITHMGVGDANGTDPIPSPTQTKLINERRRAPLNQLKVDPANSAVIVAEQVIPENVGGWWIREIGLYDSDGDMIAIANCAPSFKPLLNQGSGRTQVVRMNMIVSNSSNVELKIDPSVVLATRAYVDSKVVEELSKLDSKQSVRAATTANIALTGLQSLDTIPLTAGDRVLVKNQTAAKDNGLYVVAAGAWSRAPDADTSAKVTSALLVSVEQGDAQADTRWQLITDGAIVLGTTALTFQNITQGLAPINSPAFTGNPTAPTAPAGDNDTSVANTSFVQTAVNGTVSVNVAGSGNINLTAVQAGTARINLTGALIGHKTVTVPNIVGRYQITNSTTGNFTVTVKTAAGTGQIVTQVTSTLLYCDGVNVFQQQSDFLSPVLRGTPTAPEIPRFDTSDRIVTAKALQARGNQYSGFTSFQGAQAGTIAHVGGVVHCSGATSNSYSLPNSTTNKIPPGAVIRVQNWGVLNAALAVQGTDKMQENIDGSWTNTARYIPPDSYVDCTYIGTNYWLLTGTGVVGKTRVFGASFGINGYQKLPSGLIIQWITASFSGPAKSIPYNLPIAFPSQHFGCHVSLTDSAIYDSTGAPHTAGMVNGLGSVLLQSNYTASQSSVRVLSFGI